MPLFNSFSTTPARALGLTSGSPPLPPIIGATSSTPLTLTVNFTKVTTAFQISKFQYNINGGSWVDVLSSATSFTASGLVHATTYTVNVRSVDESGQVSTANTVSVTTAAEVAPSPPSFLATSTTNTVYPFTVSLTFTAAVQGTYAIDAYQYYVTNDSTGVTVQGSTTVGTSTTIVPTASLVHATTYRIYVRSRASVTGTWSTYASKPVTTPNEIAPDPSVAPSVSLALRTGYETSAITVTRGTHVEGSYHIASYEYRVLLTSDSSVAINWTNIGTAASWNTSALSANATYTVQVRAVATLTGTTSTNPASANIQLYPLTPAAPTLSFASQGASERVNAYLSWDAQTYATTYHVYRNGGYYAATSGTSMTVGGHSAGTGYYYQVYAGNRIGNFSGASNTKYMSTGNTVDWSSSDGTAKYIQNYGSCSNVDAGNLVITAPTSASSSGDAGYYYINTIKFEALRSSYGFAYSIGDTSRYLYFYTTGTQPVDWGGGGYRAIPKFPIYEGTGTWYEYGVYLGGADISGATFKVTTACQTGCGWGNYNSSCGANIPLSIIGRNITLTGYRMTSTTYS